MRQPTYPTSSWSSVLLHVGAAVLLCPSTGWADQILETHNATLTTYLPTAKSNIQDIRPLVDQRGVNLDGSLRQSSTHGMSLTGNPFSDGWNANQTLSGVRLDTGTHAVNNVDLAFAAEIPWVIGRSYNSRQKDSGGSYYASTGYQGKNWFQSSQPELVFYDHATDSQDVVYLIYGADRFIEFKRGTDGGQPSTDTFKAVNGATGALLIHTFDTCDLATYYDQNGMRFDFFWFADAQIDDDIEGSLWRIMDPSIDVNPYDTGDRLVTTDGNVAYVGDVGDPNTALSSGYDSSTGAITTAYDSAGRRFTYTYTSSMLTQVKAEINTGSWVEVGKVDYGYYIAADSHGEANDLKLGTITLPLTDSGISSVEKSYYWYYEGSYDATTNPGYHHQLQYVIAAEGYRKYDWTQDSLLDDDTLSAAENDLKPYASAFFKYDTDRRVKSAWFTGACGCSGAASGTHNFEYEANGSYSDGSGYDTTWKSRTIVEKPQVTYKTSSGAIEAYVTQYFDEVGQPLHRVNTSDDPDSTSPAPSFWATKFTRNSDGQGTEISSPANVTAYTHSSASFTTSTSDGLVTAFTRVSSGNLKGFVEDTKHKTGTSGSAYLDGTNAHSSRDLVVGDVNLTRPFISSRRVYSQEITSGTTGSYLTSWSYTFWSATSSAVQYIAPKILTKTNPTVSTGNNGSGSATTEKQYLRKDGSAAFTEDAASSFTYMLFSDGQITKRIDDAKTDHSTDFDVDPSGIFGVSESSAGVRRITTFAYDKQGRQDLTTQADSRELKRYYSKLKDGRFVALGYNDYDASPLKFYGPVQYTVVNQAGRTELQATIALTSNESTSALTAHIDENDGDPITAMDLGTVARLAVSIYDESGGVVEESRAYFDVPSSGAGTDGTHYDPTLYGYDDQGRRVRTEASPGTITRTDHDTRGRVVKQWIGTNDNAFDGGESSGTDNMVKTVESEFDSGNDKGNSYLTKRTFFIQDSATDRRETSFSNDVRGRVLLMTKPEAPHFFNKYDNTDHVIASGLYSSTASIVVGTDDPTTETANRVALSQGFYDELGRVWKSQRHKIDDADGSDDDNLQSLTWYDAAGGTIKVDGTELAKMKYDRLGRQTHQYTLASDNDTAYADADDVSGDIVLVENQTIYESTDSDDAWLIATISRFHDDFGTGETTGALDTNADGDEQKYTATNLEGRIQITASWFDRFGRVTETVLYGTYGGSDFDRGPASPLSVPARSDTALLTEYEFNTDGSLQSVSDPKAVETRYDYDELGRQVTVITNYVDGSPSGDSDTYTRNVYTDGLRTKFWLDIDGDNDDSDNAQLTTYTYGTTKGTSAGDSKISTGHLLQKIAYPDSSGASDVVKFAYNAQSEKIWRNDQQGTIVETNYDDSGRMEHDRVTTIASGLDTAVRRITTAYDSLGRTQTVTQYDDERAGYGSVVNEVKYTFDDWGPISKFEQDHNSAIGGTLLYDIDYAYGKSTTGRNTIRRNSLTLPNGTSISYRYGTGANDQVSRIAEIRVGLTTVVDYDYNGVNQVVGIDYPESDVFMHRFGSTSGTYPALDRFDRVTSSTWTKDLSTDKEFYDVDVTYDRKSNITLVEDNAHTGFDVEYALDGQNRLTNAQEGTWNGSSITSQTREQEWTELDKAGNWDRVKLNLNSDADYTDTNEYDDDRTHNDVNEITGRLGGTYSPTWDAAGRLTDDKAHYEYKYDAFSRLKQVLNTANQAVVVEYTYNGLGYRIGWHYDVDTDGDVDSNDEWYRFIYDQRWRIVATYRESDSHPKEMLVYHAAGIDGRWLASHVNSLVLRDRDASTDWEEASDGTLEERVYHCQNWRHDVIALIDDTGAQVEQVRYLSFGIPFGLPFGDADSNGTHDGTDESTINNWVSTSTYDVRGDVDLDGDVDNSDYATVTGVADETVGFGILSSTRNTNRRGFGGYELETAVSGVHRIYHLRASILSSDLGRWVRRLAPRPRPNAYAFAAPLSTSLLGSLLISIGNGGASPPVLTEEPLVNQCDALMTLPLLSVGDAPSGESCPSDTVLDNDDDGGSPEIGSDDSFAMDSEAADFDVEDASEAVAAMTDGYMPAYRYCRVANCCWWGWMQAFPAPTCNPNYTSGTGIRKCIDAVSCRQNICNYESKAAHAYCTCKWYQKACARYKRIAGQLPGPTWNPPGGASYCTLIQMANTFACAEIAGLEVMQCLRCL